MNIKTIGIIGAGTMGNGIAHVFARSGYNVVLVEAQQAALDRGLQAINKNLEREVAKNKITADEKASALSRIKAVTDRDKLADCDFVVEAATAAPTVSAGSGVRCVSETTSDGAADGWMSMRDPYGLPFST